jgi:predicted DNA-binding transcriptional regulator YafY
LEFLVRFPQSFAFDDGKGNLCARQNKSWFELRGEVREMGQATGKRSEGIDVVGRLLETLRQIPSSGKISARDVARRVAAKGFTVDYRTTLRDLERLEMAQFLTQDEGVPRGWSWLNADAKKMLGLPLNTALALKLAYEHVKPLMPASLSKELKGLADSAEKSLAASAGRNPFANWPDKVRVLQSGPPRTPPNIKPGVHQAVCDALLKNLQLRVHYRAATRQEEREFVVTPLGMVSKDGKIYVVVSRKDKDDDPAKFALHRFLKAEVEYIEGKTPPGWTGLDAYIDAGKFLFPPGEVEKSQWVTLRVTSAVIVRDLEEMPIGAGQTIRMGGKPRAGRMSCYLVRTRVDISGELVRWLLQYGEQVEVVGPASLRSHMAQIIGKLSLNYEKH